MLENAWLIPVFPMISMAAIMLVTHRNRMLSAGLSITAMSIAFIWSWAIAFTVWNNPEAVRFTFVLVLIPTSTCEANFCR